MLAAHRPLKKEDESFVYSSWLKSHRDSRMVHGVTDTLYYPQFHDLIENVMKDPSTKIVVACDPIDDQHIFGYAVGSLGPIPTVYWVYVKHPFRNFGLAKHLVAEFKPAIHTTLARPTSLVGDSAYNPFAMWRFCK